MNLKTTIITVINPERAYGLVEILQMSFREDVSSKVHLQMRGNLKANLTNMLYFNIDNELYKGARTSKFAI